MNMKTLFAQIVTGTVLLASSLTSTAANLSLETSTTLVQGGGMVYIDLVVSGLGDHAAPSLSTFDVDVSYDPALFALSGIVFGPMLGDESLGEAMSGSNSTTPGSINIWELSLLEPDSANCVACIPPYLTDLQGSSFTLARIGFTTSQTGTGGFGLAVNVLGDGLGDPLAATIGAAPTVTVPEPPTLALLGLGMLGLMATRSRLRTLNSTALL